MQAVNAPHHIYSYTPHRPTHLKKWIPDNESTKITWKWIKEALPTLKEAEYAYDIANMLAKPSLCTLTKLRSPDPKVQDIHNKFIRELNTLSNDVKRRKHPYNYLDPKNVACSIDI